jgi:putative Ca2+/H+ antiporter (TMEM165/GDT1 family)
MAPIDFIQALILAFSAVFLMEMGDKTQLTAFTLSMKYRAPLRVFFGVILGLTGVTILAVILGLILKETIDFVFLRPLISVLFMLGGALILVNELRKKNDDFYRICPVRLEECEKPRDSCPEMDQCDLFLDNTVRKGAFFRSSIFMFTAELGDKTMLMALGLATQFDPIGVFFGALAALTVVNAIGVFAGEKIARRIPKRTLGLISGILFIITGFLILLTYS